jgi:hypothetical protein
MGQSLTCNAKVNGARDRGTALLETEEVLFRGEKARARIPFASMTSLDVKGAWLAIAHAEGSLEIELGARAATWETAIRSPKGIVEKLGVKAGARVALVGMKDDEDFAGGLGTLGARVLEGSPRGEVDVVLLRVKTEDALARVKPLAGKLAADGAMWIVRPKGKDGVNEMSVFAAGHEAGLVDVKVAKFSQAETAMKFVVPVAKRRR